MFIQKETLISVTKLYKARQKYISKKLVMKSYFSHQHFCENVDTWSATILSCSKYCCFCLSNPQVSVFPLPFFSLGIFYQALLPYSILLCMQTLPKGQSWAAAASATKGSAGTIIISLKNFSNFLWKNLLNSTPGRKGFLGVVLLEELTSSPDVCTLKVLPSKFQHVKFTKKN